MRRFLHLILLMIPLPLAAQQGNVPLAGQRQPLQLMVLPAYQALSLDGQSITELSLPISLYLPIGRNWGLSLRGAWAQASGDGLADLSGFSDSQLFLSYYRSLGRGSVVLGLGVNLPSGRQALSRGEFTTLAALSRNEYDFLTPSFGLGLGLSPGLTVAFPLSEALVVGLGVAYRYRGAYEPLEDMIDSYAPGDELLLTGGLDVRLSRAVSFAADLTYTTYRPDEVGNAEVFEAGNKLGLVTQLRYSYRTIQSWVYVHYRSRSRSSLAVVGSELVEEAEKSLPDQVEISVGFQARLAPPFVASLVGEIRHFDETPVLQNVQSVYGAGAEVEVALSQRVLIPARFIYQLGDITGVELGLGLRTRL